jgi:hypothetical protein
MSEKATSLERVQKALDLLLIVEARMNRPVMPNNNKELITTAADLLAQVIKHQKEMRERDAREKD